MDKSGTDDFLYGVLMNMLWGFEAGGFSMFSSINSFFWWIINSVINSFLWF